MTLGSTRSSQSCLPQQYVSSPLKWLCEVIAESEGGLINEYEIEPSKRIYLKDFLIIISEKISEMSDGDVVDWGIKIYRL